MPRKKTVKTKKTKEWRRERKQAEEEEGAGLCCHSTILGGDSFGTLLLTPTPASGEAASSVCDRRRNLGAGGRWTDGRTGAMFVSGKQYAVVSLAPPPRTCSSGTTSIPLLSRRPRRLELPQGVQQAGWRAYYCVDPPPSGGTNLILRRRIGSVPRKQARLPVPHRGKKEGDSERQQRERARCIMYKCYTRVKRGGEEVWERST